MTVDTDKKTLIVHDQTQAGGFPLAREDLSNVPDTILSTRGLALADMSNVSSDDLAGRGIAKADLSNLTAEAHATLTQKGVIQLANEAEVSSGLDAQKAITPATLKAHLLTQSSVPFGFISGLTLSIGSDTDHDIVLAAGTAKSASQTHSIELTTSLTKQIDATWVAGTDKGGMPAPLTVQPHTSYHFFVIFNPTTGQIDAGFDTSLTAVNLLNVAMGYTHYRRVGSVRTEANSNLIGFKTFGTGSTLDIFYTNPVVDLNQTANPNTWTVLNLAIPSGLERQVYTQLIVNGQGIPYYSNTYFRTIGRGGEGLRLYNIDSQSEYVSLSDHSMCTNTNGQIEYQVIPQNAANRPLVTVLTLGYTEQR